MADAVALISPNQLLPAPKAGGWPGLAACDLGALRAALMVLVEDPPFTLGHSALARRMLPYEPDVLQRGWALADVLRGAIAFLRPPLTVPLDHRSWWPYKICLAEFIEGRSRGEVQVQLAISASTYTRAKHRGLERIAATLPYIAAQSPHDRPSPDQARESP